MTPALHLFLVGCLLPSFLPQHADSAAAATAPESQTTKFESAHPSFFCRSTRHVHLSVGPDPSTTMTVSFSSAPCDGPPGLSGEFYSKRDGFDGTSMPPSSLLPPPRAGVMIGTDPDRLDRLVLEKQEHVSGGVTPRRYNATVKNHVHGMGTYVSEYQRHVEVGGLRPGTRYYYKCVTINDGGGFETRPEVRIDEEGLLVQEQPGFAAKEGGNNKEAELIEEEREEGGNDDGGEDDGEEELDRSRRGRRRRQQRELGGQLDLLHERNNEQPSRLEQYELDQELEQKFDAQLRQLELRQQQRQLRGHKASSAATLDEMKEVAEEELASEQQSEQVEGGGGGEGKNKAKEEVPFFVTAPERGGYGRRLHNDDGGKDRHTKGGSKEQDDGSSSSSSGSSGASSHPGDKQGEASIGSSTAKKQDKKKSTGTGTSTSTGTGAGKNVKFAIIGDVAQTKPAVDTLAHLSSQRSSISAILLVGDIAYANSRHALWDTWFDMIDLFPIFREKPLQVAPGNHEVERDGYNEQMFLSYETRFAMPQVKPMEGGIYRVEGGTVHDGRINKGDVPYPLDYDYGNAYYSFKYGPSHNIMLSSYSNFDPGSKQYEWLVQELESVDREVTPWLTVTIHCPMYNTFQWHRNDEQSLRASEFLEPLLLEHKVNFVFSGHLHAYMRTKPVTQNRLHRHGPIHIILGNGGRQANTPYHHDTPERWVAVRDHTTYGYGTLEFVNRTHARYEWVQTDVNTVATPHAGSIDEEELEQGVKDVAVIENQLYK